MRLIDKINEHNLSKDSWALIYAHDEVHLKKLSELKDEVKNLTTDQYKEARIFNEDDELKIWHYQGKEKSRLFSKTDHSKYEVYEDEMLLLERFRKNSIIQTKSYYTFNEDGLIRFEDARLVKIEENNKEDK